jgi:hypothetical protein
MITQQDIHQAMAYPLTSERCTLPDIQEVLPGLFVPEPAEVQRPNWTERLYIEGWTLYNDAVPYRTRVCYLWTGHDDSKQQTVLIGQPTDGPPDPARPSNNAYLGRSDACLSATGTGLANYEWTCEEWEWNSNQSGPVIGLPYPDWAARDNGRVMGQIVGNPDFGLASGETLNLIAVNAGPGDIFWVWFLENGVGMMFSEATFNNSLGHLEVIDYDLFVRDADVKQENFSGPFPVAEAATKLVGVHPALGHPTSLHRRQPPGVTPF